VAHKAYQIVPGADPIEVARPNQTKQQIANGRSMLSAEKQRILAMEYDYFQRAFDDIVIKWRSCDCNNSGQTLPMLQHISEGATQAAVRLDPALLDLLGDLCAQCRQDRLTVLLMIEQALFIAHLSCLRIKAVDGCEIIEQPARTPQEMPLRSRQTAGAHAPDIYK